RPRDFPSFPTRRSSDLAKFVPGLNTVGPPLAGMLKLSPVRFGLFDLGGAGLWTGAAIALGVAFRSQLDWLSAWLRAFGLTGGLRSEEHTSELQSRSELV